MGAIATSPTASPTKDDMETGTFGPGEEAAGEAVAIATGQTVSAAEGAAPEKMPVGTTYCTYGPDESCYANGWPRCCTELRNTCPEEKPPCEIQPSGDEA